VSEFITVAKVKDIAPGDARVYFVRGREIAIFNVQGQFFAIDNLCPHQGGPLVAGEVAGEVVTCPWHRWQFHLPTGLSPIHASISVKTYPLEIVNGDVRIRVTERSRETL
jgi:nitrite reductase/ring-hydroxylating ferredoxin subunit